MANEIKVEVRLKALKGSIDEDKRVTGLLFDLAGDVYDKRVQAVGTTAEALSISAEIATLGYCYLRNHDDTNFVSVGREIAAAFEPFTRLKPGEVQLFRLEPGTVPFARADTAAVKLEMFVLPD